MWKYLLFNAAWFSLLFAADFYGHRRLKAVLLAAICAAAVFFAASTPIDPFNWVFYLMFSLLALWGARQFKHWSLGGLVALDEESDLYARTLTAERAELSRKTRMADALGDKAGEIAHLYEKVKEMSQSLEMFEAFLVFGEALAAHFHFENVKLAVFDDDASSPSPGAFYQLRRSDFEGLFDRSVFLRDRGRAKAEVFPFEQQIFEALFEKQEILSAGGSEKGETLPFMVYPAVLDKKMFAALLVMGMRKADLPTLSILTQRFLTEIQRVKLYEKIQTLAITDGLTGVCVRRHLVERLEGEIVRARRFGFKLSFLMIDIDDFKDFNDRYGHLVGDVVLKQVADTLQKSVRELDLVGRYGGEEFGILLIETDEAGAFHVAERIRQAVAERFFTAYDEKLKVTVSIGCATYSRSLQEVAMIVDAADSALYQAKRQGKNKVCLYNVSGAK